MTEEKWVFYPKGTKLIKSHLKLYEKELETTPKYIEGCGYGSQSYKWTELVVKIELCNVLLK